MADIARYARELRFRFLGPHDLPDGDGRFLLPRAHAAPARWLPLPGVPVDVYNVRLPRGELATRSTLRDVCKIPKMSTLAVGALINNAVAQMPAGQSFVNVGVWNGFTFLSGVAGNADKPCVGVDNFSQFGGPRDAFGERFLRFRGGERHQFHDVDYREYFDRLHEGPIGFYIYDGEHSYDNQLKGLQAAERFLADGCLVLVDDTNWLEPWQATVDFMRASRFEYEVLLDETTALNGHPTFWNGVMLLRRKGAKSSTAAYAGSGAGRRPEAPAAPEPQTSHWPFLLDEQLPAVSLVIAAAAGAEAGELNATLSAAAALRYPKKELLFAHAAGDASAREAAAACRGAVIPVVYEAPASTLDAGFVQGFARSAGASVSFIGPGERLAPHAIEMGLNRPLGDHGSMEGGAAWFGETWQVLRDVIEAVPAGHRMLLIDDQQFGVTGRLADRELLPFTEREGLYNGPPADDATAVAELECMRAAGVAFTAVARPGFWWLEHYPGFARHLRSRFRCTLENERLMVFDLRQTP